MTSREKKTLSWNTDGKGVSTFRPEIAYRYPCFQG
jgi:hypothetical protein